MADYGVGKTLMKKHMALKLSKEDEKSEVIFISLASAIKYDRNDKISKMNAKAVFDVACALEFKRTKNMGKFFHNCFAGQGFFWQTIHLCSFLSIKKRFNISSVL